MFRVKYLALVFAMAAVCVSLPSKASACYGDAGGASVFSVAQQPVYAQAIVQQEVVQPVYVQQPLVQAVVGGYGGYGSQAIVFRDRGRRRRQDVRVRVRNH